MSADEAARAGIDPNERFSYFRVSKGKSNMSRRSGHSEWRSLESVALGNEPRFYLPGDNVGVATEWIWPSNATATEDISPEVLTEIKSRVGSGDFRVDAQAKDWVGKIVADVLGLDVSDKADKSKVKQMIDAWTSEGHFQAVTRRCPKRREDKEFLDVV